MVLNNKTIVLTGAAGGIGRCMAFALAKAGARLILVGRNTDSLEALRVQLPKAHGTHLCVPTQLQDANARADLVGICVANDVDILINNAGVSEFRLLADSDANAIESLIALNLTVPMQLSQALVEHLQTRPEAAIINIGSAFGSIAYPGFSVYSASKFGLRGFSEALQRELSDTSVRVMHLAPRATTTEINSANIVAMNRQLGNAMDAPELVAEKLLHSIKNNCWKSLVIGWPEMLYAKINGVFPSLTTGAITKQLEQIKQFARAEAKSLLASKS